MRQLYDVNSASFCVDKQTAASGQSLCNNNNNACTPVERKPSIDAKEPENVRFKTALQHTERPQWSLRDARITAQNFSDALRQRSRQNRVQCDVEYGSWFCEPDPVQRNVDWHRIRFVEYVSSSVVAARITDDSLLLTVRLFPMLSVGYVPFQPDRDVYEYNLKWPAAHEESWILDAIPVVCATLHHQISSKKALLTVEAAVSSDRSMCTLSTLFSHDAFVEFCVALPLEKFARQPNV